MTEPEFEAALARSTPETRIHIAAAMETAAREWKSRGTQPALIRTAVRIAAELVLMAAEHPRPIKA